MFVQVTNITNEEDPGIWRDHRGNFHAIFHGPGHAWSADGLKWSFKVGIVVLKVALLQFR
jgi:hypothetical protein